MPCRIFSTRQWEQIQQFIEKEFVRPGAGKLLDTNSKNIVRELTEVKEVSLLCPLQKPHCRKSGREHGIGHQNRFGMGRKHRRNAAESVEENNSTWRNFRVNRKISLAVVGRAGWLINKEDKNGLQIIFIILPRFPVALFVPICQLDLFQVSAATNTGH